MLDIALARADHDFTISGRADNAAARRPGKSAAAARENSAVRKAGKRAGSGLSPLRYLTSRNLAIFALSAMTLGFLVNALALQKARHPAPLFAAAAPPQIVQSAVQANVASDTPMPMPRPAVVVPVQQPATIQKAALSPPRSQGAVDPIAQLLRPHVSPGKPEVAKPEPSKSVFAAQKALVKLGFVLKPDGVFGGTTRQAIERFERDQGMPVKGDLTPKMMRLLTAQSGMAAE